MVLLVAGGVPVIVVAVCAVEPMYGVILYEVTGPPVAGAVHETSAECWPASAAVAPVTWPGAGTAYMTSTQ